VRRAGILALVVLGVVPRARAEEASSLPPPRPALGVLAGLFEVTDNTYREGELGVRYRPGLRFSDFVPMVGGMVTTAGAFHLYAGVALEIEASPHLLLRLGVAPGYYDRGASGKDLGLALEFRSSLEVAWRLRSGWQVGLELCHVSNANIGSINPGAGSVLLAVTLPLGPGR